ncbi:TetR/AcrR family transcriptional regulator [Kibdelosporangium phytohabitans]|uniref:TetR family transcriptional regulator n=1 Tax=Kibdelosporangium phytohabitans TaxID=860235 RepID=A0A0N9HYG7_9PSEU|nr:TetR/AcrR family transcriptional regulator [Kibdelosporangium phytohabitans]ALG12382.1 TetR family transcriptional regulator [Kibdelosporangium phytohabitans]MBE1463958.1 AcrR family transcriptional regulator [Kibdelosporangium phytohabitans]
MRRSAAEMREHILVIAHELFYWHGIRAVGIDKVAAEAGVAPTTLYRIFANKDDLVAAYVERTNDRAVVRFNAAADQAGPDPRTQILAMFDALIEHMNPAGFRGCACMMTLAEFPDPEVPAHQKAIAAKTWVRERLHSLTARIDGVRDAPALADQLVLIWEGANASAQALGLNGPAGQARQLAVAVIDGAVRTS